MRKIVVVLILFTVSLSGIAGNIDKGFEALRMYNYFEAKKIFEKSLKKKTVAASFGLTKVFDAEKSPFFNADTAYKFLMICDSTFRLADEKERAKLLELGIDSMAIHKEKVYLAEFFFVYAVELNTVEAYDEFIRKHPVAKDLQEAIKLRNHAAYLVALDSNTISSWEHFLQTYPDATDYEAAKKQLEILEYTEMTKNGDAESFRLFVEKYPDNPYTHDAQEMVYQMYTEDRKIESYLRFIKDNPNNKNVERAWEMIYRLSIPDFTSAQIFEFMIDFPDYPDKQRLRADLDLALTPFFPARKDGLWGFVDTNGIWMITPKYAWASDFSEGKAVVGFLEKSVFIDKHGSLIFKHLFDDAESFSNHLAMVEIDVQYGVINFLGDTVIPIQYDELGEMSSGLMYAGLDGKYGYFNAQGDLVIDLIYDNAFDFENGLAIVKSDSGYGVINDSGRVVVPLVYETVLPDTHLCIAKWEGKYGVLAYTGDTLVDFVYDALGHFYNDRAIAANGNIFRYINSKGEVAIDEDFVFNDLSLTYSQFHDGYARVIVKNKVGIIDTTGQRVYPAIFADVGKYNPMLTAVTKGNMWGYANRKVKLVIPYQYNFAYDFEDSLAIVANDTSQAIINSNNQFVVPFGWEKVKLLENGFLQVEKLGKYGILTLQNDTVLEAKYTQIQWLSPEVLLLHRSQKMELFWIARNRFIYKEE